jgi:hypothetical protein
MFSKASWIISICLVCIVLLHGCTEKLPLDPVYTDDTDWAPSIALISNGYQRIRLYVEQPPRKELLRNILFYTAEIRESRSGVDASIDTLKVTAIPAAYVYVGSGFISTYQSIPILDYGTDYAVRFVVHYRTGISRYLNDLPFTTPLERGRVLKRLPLPSEILSDSYGAGDFLAFHKASLLILRNEKLFRIDTASGQSALLKSDFAPPTSNLNETFRSLTVAGDSAYTFYGSKDHFRIVSLDLNTLQVDSSLEISYPGRYLVNMTCRGSSLYALWESSGRQQFTIVDRRNGQLVDTLPSAPARIPYPYTVVSDGSNFWYSHISWYDNRIIRFDPSTLTFWEEHRNPFFSTESLAWDGANFWVVDLETDTIAKLQLDGL